MVLPLLGATIPAASGAIRGSILAAKAAPVGGSFIGAALRGTGRTLSFPAKVGLTGLAGAFGIKEIGSAIFGGQSPSSRVIQTLSGRSGGTTDIGGGGRALSASPDVTTFPTGTTLLVGTGPTGTTGTSPEGSFVQQLGGASGTIKTVVLAAIILTGLYLAVKTVPKLVK